MKRGSLLHLKYGLLGVIKDCLLHKTSEETLELTVITCIVRFNEFTAWIAATITFKTFLLFLFDVYRFDIFMEFKCEMKFEIFDGFAYRITK